MTRAGVDRELAAAQIELKSTSRHVAVVESCERLPSGDGSLSAWLALADRTFRRLLDGEDVR